MYKFIDKNNLTVYDYCLIYYYLKNKDENSKIIKNEFLNYLDNIYSSKIDKKYEQFVTGGIFLRFSILNGSNYYTINDYLNKTHGYISNFIITTSMASHFLNYSKDYRRIEVDNHAFFSYIGNAKEKIPSVCEDINTLIILFNYFNIDYEKSIKTFMGLEDKSIEEIIKDLEKKNRKNNRNDANIVNDKKTLIKYLEEVVEIKSDIYSLQNRYLELEKKLEQISYIGLFVEPCKSILNSIETIKKDRKDLRKYEDSRPTLEIFINNIKIEKPKFNYVKPVKPILKKASFLNKKRIEQENIELLDNYQSELEKYELAKKEYDRLLLNYEEQYQSLQNDATSNFQIALDKFEKEDNKRQEIIKEKQNELDSIKEKPINDILNENNKNYEQAKKITYEMNYVVNCLDKEIDILEQMLSYNVIYGKYRNYIALSSMLDYLLSGRCDTLEGNTGAYNLYEQESRSDIIINKMDVIIDKLDTISKNQYYLYSKICEVNDSLLEISNLLLINNFLQVGELLQLSDISLKASEIASNTNEIAYNSKVASYYAEKTAHYTEALTYLKYLNG